MTKVAEDELRLLHQEKILNTGDVKVLLAWVDEMEEFGPTYIAQSPKWHDHVLRGKWTGFRASAFSSSGRVIYRIEERLIVVQVYRVTTDHNYKR